MSRKLLFPSMSTHIWSIYHFIIIFCWWSKVQYIIQLLSLSFIDFIQFTMRFWWILCKRVITICMFESSALRLGHTCLNKNVPALVHSLSIILTSWPPGEIQVAVFMTGRLMEAISGVWCYQPRGVLLINPPDRTETPQGQQISENNHLLWCERGDWVGKQKGKTRQQGQQKSPKKSRI